MSSSGSTTRICRVTFCEKYTRVPFYQALNFAVLPSPPLPAGWRRSTHARGNH